MVKELGFVVERETKLITEGYVYLELEHRQHEMEVHQRGKDGKETCQIQ